jgi:membrane protein
MATAEYGRRDARLGAPAPLLAAVLTAASLVLGFHPRRFSGGPFGRDAAVRVRSPANKDGAAASPSEIPASGWWAILMRVYSSIGKDRVVALAAGVTFYSVLALFPAIAALVALYGLFADPGTIAGHLDAASGILPGGAMQVIGDEMKRIAAQGNNTLGVTFLVGLVTALWSANAGMKSIFDTLNVVYKEPEKRGIVSLNSISLSFTVAAIIFALLAIGAMVVLPVALEYFGVGDFAHTLITILRWPALLIVVMFGLALIYRFGPSRAKPKWRWITYGSAFAAVAWLVLSLLFTWYAAHFGSYNKTYGSLGAVIGFMIWIWLSVIVVLIGAEINAETERQARLSRRPAPAG